ncbi:UNVERIFIED_ORG: lipopolysaccharide biosynthesis glycosyltransferase [Martelella mediterranea]
MISREIFISVVYSEPAPLVKTGYLNPIQTGRALGGPAIEGALGDDTGRNNSSEAVFWNGLTALYWMRHNVDAEYYGLMQSRRLLAFAEKKPRGLSFGEVTAAEYVKYGWRDDWIEKACRGADILTPPMRPLHLSGLPDIVMTASDFFAHQHHAADLTLVEGIVKARAPQIYPYLVQVLTGRRVFPDSISVMRKPFFLEYADFLIDTLEAAQQRIDVSGYDAFQQRVGGFLSEYLTCAYVAYAKSVHEAKVRELPLATGVRPRPPVSPDQVLSKARTRRDQGAGPVQDDASARSDINIVLAVDDNYVPHAAVTMLSALKTSAVPSQLRFFVLNGHSISQTNRAKLEALVTGAGGRLSFTDIDDRDLRWLPLNRDYISIATYYRLVMHDYLPADVEKAIYLDADTVVVEPLERLWAIDLEGHPVAGAPDDAGLHQARRLRLDAAHRYFNAGIMVFDIARFREMELTDEILAIFRAQGPFIISQDQDILNILFCNDTKLLPLCWNAGTRIYRSNPLEPAYSEAEALEAARAPAIVHFTDAKKPWHTKCTHPFTELYWDYRNETHWAEGSAHKLKRRLVQRVRRWLRASDRRFERHLRAS